jgi:hypothetical protein
MDEEIPLLPTPEGMRRYPYTTGYYEDLPCICMPSCARPCTGTCGCEACIAAYTDTLFEDPDAPHP